MTIKISDSVPAPEAEKQQKARKGRKGDGRQEAILKLKVGESFWLKTSISSASSLKWWAKARHPEREYTAAKEKDGTRIWRTR